MRISKSCEECLFDKQASKVKDEAYLNEVKQLLKNRNESDTAPYMVYLFDKLYQERFHHKVDYKKEKQHYNDLALSLKNAVEHQINQSSHPIKQALLYSRIGNYIDFGAMSHVNEEEFLKLFQKTKLSQQDEITYDSFINKCQTAKNFVLLTDNCGEIVFDGLLLNELKNQFPQLEMTIICRGDDVLNDATLEDIYYVGLNQYGKVIPNGTAVAGTIYSMISQEAKDAIDQADIILSKGQGNYESFSNQGFHAYYLFLCKCQMFCEKFNVEKLTGMFIEE